MSRKASSAGNPPKWIRIALWKILAFIGTVLASTYLTLRLTDWYQSDQHLLANAVFRRGSVAYVIIENRGKAILNNVLIQDNFSPSRIDRGYFKFPSPKSFWDERVLLVDSINPSDVAIVEVQFSDTLWDLSVSASTMIEIVQIDSFQAQQLLKERNLSLEPTWQLAFLRKGNDR